MWRCCPGVLTILLIALKVLINITSAVDVSPDNPDNANLLFPLSFFYKGRVKYKFFDAERFTLERLCCDPEKSVIRKYNKNIMIPCNNFVRPSCGFLKHNKYETCATLCVV